MSPSKHRSWWSGASLALLVAVLLGAAVFGGTGRGNGVFAQAQEGTPGPSSETLSSVSVGGHGAVLVEPDIASVVLGVNIINASLSQAQAQATERMTAILEVVTDAGIAEEDVQTVNYSINLVQEYDNQGNATRVVEYQVSNQVNVKVRDLDELGPLLDAVVTAGANNIYGISFSVDDPGEAASQARRLAVEDARAKADEMADALGMRVGRVVTVTESFAPPPTPQIFESRADVQAAGQAVPIQTGTSEVVVDIQVTYELIDGTSAGANNANTVS